MKPLVHLAGDPVTTLAEWTGRGGGTALATAVEIGPWHIIDEVRLSGLRGRGGGGFRTGRKWATVRQDARPWDRTFVVANGAEGEPGTFKDRAILRHNPYQVLEGLAIAAFAVGADHAYLALKSTFEREIAGAARALEEMRAAGLAGEVPITIVLGPDSYLFGEEKALLEVVQGEDPLPRRDPPHIRGLFATGPQMGWQAEAGSGSDERPAANPTVVNNVETLSAVPQIVANGAEWYRGFGTNQSPGSMVFTVVGDVARPGYEELELGVPLREVIARVGGGTRPGRSVKAVFSGVANAVITPDQLDVPASYEGLSGIGSGLGAAGFIVYDDTADMVEVARVFSRFLWVESCGQCLACKLNSGAVTSLLERLERDEDIVAIGAHLREVTDQNRCYLPVEEQIVVSSILRAFPEEFLQRVEGVARPGRDYVLPKLVDLADGVATYDARTALKQPDWTYATAVTPTRSSPAVCS